MPDGINDAVARGLLKLQKGLAMKEDPVRDATWAVVLEKYPPFDVEDACERLLTTLKGRPTVARIIEEIESHQAKKKREEAKKASQVRAKGEEQLEHLWRLFDDGSGERPSLEELEERAAACGFDEYLEWERLQQRLRRRSRAMEAAVDTWYASNHRIRCTTRTIDPQLDDYRIGAHSFSELVARACALAETEPQYRDPREDVPF